VPFPGGEQPSAVEAGDLTLCLNCLVSCKINTLLYIFREQKKCCYRVHNFHFEHFSGNKLPQRSIFEYSGHIFGSVKYAF
jgi:hypothetical protein